MKYYSSFTLTPENALSNRALSYGDGVFETMLCIDKKIPLFELHWQRLNQSLDRLKIKRLSRTLIENKINQLSDKHQNQIFKLTVFRKDNMRSYLSLSSEVDFILSVHPYVAKPFSKTLMICSTRLSKQKQTAGMKHLSRIEQVLASQELIDTDYQDGIMLDFKNRIIETTNKNIIFIKQGKIYSPKLNNCGVYGVALSWLQAAGFEVVWKNIKLKNINKFDAVMVGNSIIGFKTITLINKTEFESSHKIMNLITNKWQEALES